MSDKIKPQLGMLPAIPDRPMLEMRALAVAPVVLPAPLPEVHNIELVPDSDMLGNDVWGNCVFVAIENNRRIAAAALGAKITRLTAPQVVAKYTAFTGVKVAPGPGAVIQLALEWVRKTPAGWGGNHLLAFGRPPRTQDGARETVSEFQSGIFGVTIHQSQEYPARVFDQKLDDPKVGGHAMGGGTYTQLAEFAKTWGYMISMTPAYFAGSVGEISVLIWDFQWESLSFERQTALIADVQALTGKTWTGPAPVKPIPEPIVPQEVNMQFLPKPIRLFDAAVGVGVNKVVQGRSMSGPYLGNPVLFNTRNEAQRAHAAAVAAEQARQTQETAESIGLAIPAPHRKRTEPVAPAIDPAPVAETTVQE